MNKILAGGWHMNDRQLLAFGNPIIFGKSHDESIFERVINRKGFQIRTKLTVQAPILHRPAVWHCEAAVLDDDGRSLPMVELTSDQRRILSVVIAELLDNVGVGKRVMTESGKRMLVSRDLAREEFEVLAEILNGGHPLPEIKRG
jgi:hypothetical protein